MQGNHAVGKYDAVIRKRRIFMAVLAFFAVPAVILLGSVFFHNKSYLLVSSLMIIITMLPFVFVFEKRRPRAREIVLLAAMTSLVVTANLICSIGIPLHAGTALVIITGISLGPEAGFLVGVISRFICNFFQGQGAWTPWEMFCWGMLGFVAGMVFSKVSVQKMRSRSFQIIVGPLVCVLFSWVAAYVAWLLFHNPQESFWGWRLYAFGAAGLLAGMLLQRKRMPADDFTVTLFAFFSVFIIYGGIMNFASMVTIGGGGKDLASLKLLYISGLPYDLLHACTAAACCFVFGDKMICKLERIKIKFGIYR